VLGSAARLNIEGQTTLRGEVDARIWTEVGPELQGRMRSGGLAASVVGRVGDLLVVPVLISARGQIPKLRFAARPGLPSHALGDTVRFGVGILRELGGNDRSRQTRRPGDSEGTQDAESDSEPEGGG